MKLSNLEMSEKSIDVQENDKDVQENDMLLAEVRHQVNPLSFCACTHFVQRIYITPHRTSAEERAPVHWVMKSVWAEDNISWCCIQQLKFKKNIPKKCAPDYNN